VLSSLFTEWRARRDVQIRDAVEHDFAAITAIYNEVLTHSTAIYNDRPATREERIGWANARRERGYPVLVAEEDAQVVGFATFGDFRSWPGYRFTVECTVHIHSEWRGRGVGSALLNELIARANAAGKHSIMAAVDSENKASLRFLERLGFVRVGHLPEVGFKFGRFLDLVLLQYRLAGPKNVD
jgi:L-amino acid N-acyltransferase